MELVTKNPHDQNTSPSPHQPPHSSSPSLTKPVECTTNSVAFSSPSTEKLDLLASTTSELIIGTIRIPSCYTTPTATLAVPSIALTPLVLTKPIRTKSIDHSKVTKAVRSLCGLEKEGKTFDDHILLDSDSEKNLSNKINTIPITTSYVETSPKPIVTYQRRSKYIAKKRKLKELALEKEKQNKSKIPLVLPEDQEIFEQSWKVKPMAPSRFYQFESVYAGEMNIYKFVEPQQWTDFFKIKETVYPHVVQSFYFNANIHHDKNLIVSIVKGTKIQLTPEIIGNILGIPCVGNAVYGTSWFSTLNVNREELISELFTEEGTKMVRPLSTQLKKEYKVLHNMCQYCIFPRVGSMERVNDNDLMILYHFIKRIRLNIPYVIIQHMINTAQSGKKRITIPHGMIMTKVFKKNRVDLKGEYSENECTSFSFKNIRHMKNDDEESTDLRAKRKRDEAEKHQMWNSLIDDMEGTSQKVLKDKDFQPSIQGTLSESLSLGRFLHLGPPVGE
ncbi:hypothetical protein A2U01_0000217 [Trifolium medium]|uniref:Putative plant transposon protein domain-containing protein n=1 Tax=Trifolium medium TaxID=97028 RepID=A0A392LX09_9FABA|nr:hypothetical protein [Trifolium medium]